MRKVKLGTFCRYNIILEVNDNDIHTDKEWVDRWENWLESEKKYAVEKKESEKTIKWMEKEINKKKENLQIILK